MIHILSFNGTHCASYESYDVDFRRLKEFTDKQLMDLFTNQVDADEQINIHLIR